MSERFMNAVEVGEMLGKSPDWVRRRVADKTIPHRYVGRDLRFIRAEVLKWVDDQTRIRNDGPDNPEKKN